MSVLHDELATAEEELQVVLTMMGKARHRTILQVVDDHLVDTGERIETLGSRA